MLSVPSLVPWLTFVIMVEQANIGMSVFEHACVPDIMPCALKPLCSWCWQHYVSYASSFYNEETTKTPIN